MELNTTLINRQVLPGDVVGTQLAPEPSDPSSILLLGRGIFPHPRSNDIISTEAGVLRRFGDGSSSSPSGLSTYYHIESLSRKHYVPRLGEPVIGIVTRSVRDFHILDIASGRPALLQKIGFDGATKRNRPDLQRGDLVYARVVSCNARQTVDAEVTCTTPKGRPRRDWIYEDGEFGPLSGGDLIRDLTLGNSLSLNRPNCVIWPLLGEYVKFQLVVGMNGRCWIKCDPEVADAKMQVLVGSLVRTAVREGILSDEERIRETMASMVESLRLEQMENESVN